MTGLLKKSALAVAAAATLAVGGAAIANATGSQTTTTTSTTPQSSSSAPPAPAFDGPPHGTAAHEDAEKAVTGAAAEKAQAAAVKLVGSGTAGAVTTDFTQTGYEVTVTRSDGSTVEVHLDSSFNALQGHGGPPPGTA